MKAFRRIAAAALFACALMCLAFSVPALAEEEVLYFCDTENMAVTGNSTDASSASEYLTSSRYEKAVAYFIKAVKNYETTIDLSEYEIPTDAFRSFYKGAQEDHPEMFWLPGKYYYTQSGGYIKKISILYINQDEEVLTDSGYAAPTSAEKNEIKQMRAEYEKKVKAILNGIPSAYNTDLKKVLYLHDYLAQAVVYNFSPVEDSYTAYGALCTGKAVCAGYSMAYKDLLTRLDIPCRYVRSDEMNHAWNLVKVNGSWYEMDVTWDNTKIQGYVKHDYCLLSTAEMVSIHGNRGTDKMSYSWKALPACTSTVYDNYLFRDAASRVLTDGNGNWYYFGSDGWYYKAGSLSAAYGDEVFGIARYPVISQDHTEAKSGSGMGWYMTDDTIYYVVWDTIYAADLADAADPVPVYTTGGTMIRKIDLKGKTLYVTTASGVTQTTLKDGWVKGSDGTWYCYSGGRLLHGWIKYNKSWYYLDPSTGAMVTYWKTVDGKRYYFSSSGSMKTGWIHTSGNYYYADPKTGAVVTGWKKIGGVWYYFDSSRKMVRGKNTIDGEIYFFSDSGAMKTGWLETDEGWLYFDLKKGSAVKKWELIGGKYYHFNAKTHIMDTGWYKDTDGKYYWLGTNGVMRKGWVKISGKWYYFKSGGDMAVNETLKIDGKYYTFGKSGAWKGSAA